MDYKTLFDLPQSSYISDFVWSFALSFMLFQPPGLIAFPQYVMNTPVFHKVFAFVFEHSLFPLHLHAFAQLSSSLVILYT